MEAQILTVVLTYWSDKDGRIEMYNVVPIKSPLPYNARWKVTTCSLLLKRGGTEEGRGLKTRKRLEEGVHTTLESSTYGNSPTLLLFLTPPLIQDRGQGIPLHAYSYSISTRAVTFVMQKQIPVASRGQRTLVMVIHYFPSTHPLNYLLFSSSPATNTGSIASCCTFFKFP